MTRLLRPNLARLSAMGSLWAFVACSLMGTNTGNGDNGGTGGSQGFLPASGGAGFYVHPPSGGAVYAVGGSTSCPANVCEEPVVVNGPDEVTFRGSVRVDTQLSGSREPSDAASAPVVSLVFSGRRVESAAICEYDPSILPASIHLCIPSAGAWVDGAGSLHVHDAPNVGCNGPSASEPWGLDMALSENGMLTASVFPPASDSGAPSPEYSISGQIEGYVAVGPNGENLPLSISLGDGGTFTFPTTPVRNNSCNP